MGVALVWPAPAETKTVEEVKVAIRVLATIPDLSPAPREPVASPRGSARPMPRASARRAAAKPPVEAARSRGDRVPRRRHRKSVFPTSSIVALAVIAAAIWSYVAVREIRGPEAAKAAERVAADVGSASQETTVR